MSVEFVRSAAEPWQFPRDGLPEVAFIGRSNVGKSSLLNSLLLSSKLKTGAARAARKQLAQVSRTPGRTQQLNLYLVDKAFYFVDFPGYGYAKVPKREMARWRQLAESYLTDRKILKLVILIVDSRHGAKVLDRQMHEWLAAHDQPLTLVASKTDKLRASERQKALYELEQDFHTVLPFSAKTGEGVSSLWSSIRDALTR
jgi:GTP-binding protein